MGVPVWIDAQHAIAHNRRRQSEPPNQLREKDSLLAILATIAGQSRRESIPESLYLR
jgi:hypothetical protein